MNAVTDPGGNTRPINSLVGHVFEVKDYQRGYKWTMQQVLDLLQDVHDYDIASGGFYCLQPLALKRLDNMLPTYEVIDGQQRLTTIYIMLSYIDKPHFDLSYQTRSASADFLHSIGNFLKECGSHSIDIANRSEAKKLIDASWKEYAAKNPVDDKPDNYYFYQAFKTIEAWFRKHEDREGFRTKLMNHVRFIWYEEKTATDAKEVFRDINSGKIPLTNAELIKAHFINRLQDPNADIQALQQNELASEWDYIERTLHDAQFWFFLTNETDEDRYETRIDLLFELISGPPPGRGTDKLFTYRMFSRAGAFGTAPTWNDAKICFYQMQEWYEDNDLYHLIGFLICAKIGDLRRIRKASENCGKNEFKKRLLSLIQDHFHGLCSRDKMPIDEYLDQLSYLEDYEQINTVLLIYNIELSRTSNAHYRFPFDKFKSHRWTLEHIHAQNADKLSRVEEIRSWVEDIKHLMDQSQGSDDDGVSLFDETQRKSFGVIDESLKELERAGSEVVEDELKNQVNRFSEYVTTYFALHNIRNMALLDGATNSSFGKKTFKGKRSTLIEIDKRGWDDSDSGPKAFIPVGTKNVFLKYTSSDVSQMDVWGWQDREDYFAHIMKTLRRYLPENISEGGLL